MTTTRPGDPLLTAATPQGWLATHLAAHQAGHDDEDGPSEHTWVGVAELLADGAAHLRNSHARLVNQDGATPPAAAKWLVSWFAGNLADVVGFTYAAGSAALLVRPERARFRLDPDGWPDRVDPGPAGIAVVPEHPWAGQDEVEIVAGEPELAAAAVDALIAVAEPIVEACRSLARVGRTALWAEVADGFGLPVLFQIDLPVDGGVVDRLQQAVRASGRPWRQVPDLRVAATDTGWTYLGRKAGCCLAYQCRTAEPDPEALTERERAYRARFPDHPDEPRYCSTCSLRYLGSCEERQVFWLAQERAERRSAATEPPGRADPPPAPP